jgi:hypothetical protein
MSVCIGAFRGVSESHRHILGTPFIFMGYGDALLGWGLANEFAIGSKFGLEELPKPIVKTEHNKIFLETHKHRC